ncbi:hypothetical protein [Fusobacterium necrophorum]|uniref:hypothetical protein n=1 Tax=Fusobacterium necrophorum TaxID=859 RepID=UPI00370E9024
MKTKKEIVAKIQELEENIEKKKGTLEEYPYRFQKIILLWVLEKDDKWKQEKFLN